MLSEDVLVGPEDTISVGRSSSVFAVGGAPGDEVSVPNGFVGTLAAPLGIAGESLQALPAYIRVETGPFADAERMGAKASNIRMCCAPPDEEEPLPALLNSVPTDISLPDGGTQANPANYESVLGILIDSGDTVYLRFNIPDAPPSNDFCDSDPSRPECRFTWRPVVALDGPSRDDVDFDLFARCDAPPDESTFDASAVTTNSSDELLVLESGYCKSGTVWVAVHSRVGSGTFRLRASPFVKVFDALFAELADGPWWPISLNEREFLEGSFRVGYPQLFGVSNGTILVRSLVLRDNCACGVWPGCDCDISLHREIGWAIWNMNNNRSYIWGPIRRHVQLYFPPICDPPDGGFAPDANDDCLRPRKTENTLGQTISHELMHYLEGVRDEYDQLNPHIEECGHTIMARSFEDRLSLCTDEAHRRDSYVYDPDGGLPNVDPDAGAPSARHFDNPTATLNNRSWSNMEFVPGEFKLVDLTLPDAG